MGRLIIPFILLALLPMNASSNEVSQLLSKQARKAIVNQNYKKAQNLCEQAMAADPSDASGFACLGRSLAKSKQGKKADKYYALALARVPNDENTLGWAGLRDLDKGRSDKARTKLQRLEKNCGGCKAAKILRAAYDEYKAKKNASR
jgi:Flp pilus assembly protein TadD